MHFGSPGRTRNSCEQAPAYYTSVRPSASQRETAWAMRWHQTRSRAGPARGAAHEGKERQTGTRARRWVSSCCGSPLPSRPHGCAGLHSLPAQRPACADGHSPGPGPVACTLSGALACPGATDRCRPPADRSARSTGSTTTTALESSESLWSSVVSDVSETTLIGACTSPAGSVSSGGGTAGPAPPPIRSEGCRLSRLSKGWTAYGQPAHGAVRRATARQAIRRGPIPEGEEGELREQFDRVAVLDQRVSPRAGQDKSEHSLRCAGSEGRDPPSPAEAKQWDGTRETLLFFFSSALVGMSCSRSASEKDESGVKVNDCTGTVKRAHLGLELSEEGAAQLLVS